MQLCGRMSAGSAMGHQIDPLRRTQKAISFFPASAPQLM